MPVSERQAEHAVASNSRATRRDGLSPTTSASDLTPTAAWSRRVRWIGGLIQVAFAAFWLVRGSAVIGGGVAGALIAVSGVVAVGAFVYAFVSLGGLPRGQRARRASGSSARSRSRRCSSSRRRLCCRSS